MIHAVSNFSAELSTIIFDKEVRNLWGRGILV